MAKASPRKAQSRKSSGTKASGLNVKSISRYNSRYLPAAMFLVALIAFFYLVVYPYMGVANLPKEKPVLNYPPVSDQASCESSGGAWGPIGLQQREMCNFPTQDKGKRCYDSIQCQGECIADVSQEEIDNAHGELSTHGRCTGWTIISGCKARVNNGRVYGVMCID